MSTAVAAPLQQPPSYSYPNMANSPTQATKQRNNRPSRPRNNNVNNNNNSQNTQSDSGLPSQAQTPKSKKNRPRQNDHRAASSSDVPKSTRSRPINKSPIIATPAKPAAYAGPTFHASPAASNLPMPKFASKSVPPASTSSLQAKLDAESTKANARSPAPEPAAPAALTREKSPLDIFFNADRQERAKKSASPSISRRVTPPDAKAMFPMDMEGSNSPAATRSPAPPAQPNNAIYDQAEVDRQASTQSLKKFLNLQPTSASPAQPRPQPNPAFQTPQQQRTLEADPSLHYGNRNLSPLFHAARNSPAHASPQRVPSSQSQEQFDPRAYLESHMPHQQSPFVSRPPSACPPMQPWQQAHQSPVQFVGPQHPQPPPLKHHSHSDYSPDVKGMEAKLRGMLKLG